MGLLYTWTAGLVIWIVLWALGAKAFDAMLVTIAMLLIAVIGHIVWPFLPGNRGTPAEHEDPAPY